MVTVFVGSLAFFGLWVGLMILGAETQRWWGPWVDRLTSSRRH